MSPYIRLVQRRLYYRSDFHDNDSSLHADVRKLAIASDLETLEFCYINTQGFTNFSSTPISCFVFDIRRATNHA